MQRAAECFPACRQPVVSFSVPHLSSPLRPPFLAGPRPPSESEEEEEPERLESEGDEGLAAWDVAGDRVLRLSMRRPAQQRQSQPRYSKEARCATSGPVGPRRARDNACGERNHSLNRLGPVR